jgi:prepilin-type N-terminal cleavage/methylation domain-containing protein
MKKAFTLIEIIVVVGVLGVIMSVIVGIMTNTFKSKNKIFYRQKVEENGEWIISEIRKTVLNASLVELGADNNKLLNVYGGDEGDKEIKCEGDDILIDSQVLNTGVGVSCSDFVIENKTVSIGFSLSAGNEALGVDNYAVRSFETKITLRN